MCGIVGSLTPNKILSAERKRSALSLLGHRGPDEQGEFQDISLGVWMGHVRLSILDLSLAGKQPMSMPDGSLVLTFNGEIYNYASIKKELMQLGREFHSQSDTEVVLHAWAMWGKECVHRLNGMFAFAIWEKATNRIYLGRDRAGEKPLYYSQIGKNFYFSSEITSLKALLDFPLEIDPEGFSAYLSDGYIAGELTCWKSVKKIPQGHLASCDALTQTFSIESFTTHEKSEMSLFDGNHVENLESILGEVVKDQLVADVPVGLMLSGGLDSSLLASFVAESSPSIAAFTVTFPGHQKLDEQAYSKEIADYFGLSHQEIPCDQVDSADWFRVISKLDTPISDPAFYPTYLMSKAIRTQCKVAIGGDGADEVFGGYERYSDMLSLKNQADKIPLFIRKWIGFGAKNLLPIGIKGRHRLLELSQDVTRNPPKVPSLFLESELADLLKPEFHSYISKNKVLKSSENQTKVDWIAELLRQDFIAYLSDQILTKVDRASMQASLEVRAPYLDRRILDFAELLPSNLKIEGTNRKIILKQLAEKRLPPNWDKNRKQGFVPPLDHWLNAKEWKGLIEEFLLGNSSPFNKEFIRGLLLGQEIGRFNKRRIYSLLVLAIHLKTMQG